MKPFAPWPVNDHEPRPLPFGTGAVYWKGPVDDPGGI